MTATEHAPPPDELVDVEAEIALLGSMILDPHAAMLVAGAVRAADFSARGHGELFDVLAELHSEGRSVDVVLLRNELEARGVLGLVGGASGLSRIAASVPSSRNAQHYATIVRTAAVRRRLARVGAELVTSARDLSVSLDELEAHVEHVSDELRSGEASETTDIRDVLTQSFRHHVENRPRDTLIQTGLFDLDDCLGGLPRGGMTVIAGRPSMGKSALATTLLEDLSRRDLTTLLVSLEMDQFQCWARVAAAASRIPLRHFLDPPEDGLSPELWAEFERSVAGLRGTADLWCPTYAPTPRQIAAQALQRQARLGRRLDVVIVDYCQLVNTEPVSKQYRSREQEVAWVSRSLLALARRLDCAVVLLAQLNRESVKTAIRRPRLSDLRESGALEQDAHAVIFTHRPSFYAATDGGAGDEFEVPDELVVAKNRNGPIGVVAATYSGDITRWDNRAVGRAWSYEVE